MCEHASSAFALTIRHVDSDRERGEGEGGDGGWGWEVATSDREQRVIETQDRERGEGGRWGWGGGYIGQRAESNRNTR